MIVHGRIVFPDGRVEPDDFEYPEWPAISPVGNYGPIDPATVHAGSAVIWLWRWMDCEGNMYSSGHHPGSSVCWQPGVCVIHDSPGTVVPF